MSESETSAAPVFEITEVDWAGKNCLAKRETVKFQDMAGFFASNFPAMQKAIETAGAKTGNPLGVYYQYDEKAMNADMAAAMPYEGKKVLAKGFTNLSLPAGKAYLIDYWGDYANMGAAYGAMDAKLKEIGKTNPDLVVEEYVAYPMNEKDTSKWNTKIYFFVK